MLFAILGVDVCVCVCVCVRVCVRVCKNFITTDVIHVTCENLTNVIHFTFENSKDAYE